MTLFGESLEHSYKYRTVPCQQKKYTLIIEIVPIKYWPVSAFIAKYRTVPVFLVTYRLVYANLNKILNFCTLIFLFFEIENGTNPVY